MFQLHPSPFHSNRFLEYLNERKLYYFYSTCLNILGYGCFFAYLSILILKTNPNPEYLLLDVFSLITRLSLFIVFKFFEIPNIVLEIKDKNFSYTAMKTIESNREIILGTMFKNFFGYGYDRNLVYQSKEELIQFLNSKERWNWKKIGKIYFILHTLLTPIFFIYIFQID